jgi:hypothetical protein
MILCAVMYHLGVHLAGHATANFATNKMLRAIARLGISGAVQWKAPAISCLCQVGDLIGLILIMPGCWHVDIPLPKSVVP